jgi:hypothetical protein
MRSTALVCALMTVGCIGEDSKGEEEELLDDGKADSQRKPTDHGFTFFGLQDNAVLTDAERYHAWQFDVTGDAKVEVHTSYTVLGQRKTDTVLYLYKEGPNGWGSYIARNDDYDGKVYSQIIKNLGAGRYRILVKGFSATTKGKFSVFTSCEGAGCAPPPPSSTCLFGETYHDLETAAGLELGNGFTLTLANLDTLGDDLKAMVVKAVQQSSHTDVTTPEEALDRVDQGEINVDFYSEPEAQRQFVAMEYGAGDNSYGGIFERTTGNLASSIHDGDLENCSVTRETCVLSDDWAALRTDPAFERTTTTVVKQASQLDALGTAQALEVFRHSYGSDVTTVAQGLAMVDRNELNVVSFTHKATGTKLTVLEYGAGDTSVGGVFFEGSLNLAGRINDLAIEGCTFFAD